MRPIIKYLVAGAVSTTLLASPASAACWSQTEINAAKVRTFETMLMVSALRCTSSEHDLLRDYNNFVRAKRPLLAKMNVIMRAHFGKGKSAKRALNDYDNYIISIANRYGAGTSRDDCSEMAALAKTAVRSDVSTIALVNLANAAGSHPKLPGGTCSINVALRLKE